MKKLILITVVLVLTFATYAQTKKGRAIVSQKIDVGRIDTLYFENDTLYLTEEGILFKTEIITGGADNHAELDNLSFATAGHTDFVSTNTSQTISGWKTFSNVISISGVTNYLSFTSGGYIRTFNLSSAPSGLTSSAGAIWHKNDGHLWFTNNSESFDLTAGSSALTDPMTTRGDIIYRNSSNVTARLPAGPASYIIQSDGTDIDWVVQAAGHNAVTLNANATAAGLSLSTQELNYRAATNVQNGYMSSTLVGNIENNNAFRTTPSTVILAGDNLSWTGNTLNATGTGLWEEVATDGVALSVVTDEVRIGSATDMGVHKLQVTGSARVSTDLYVGDNLVVDGAFFDSNTVPGTSGQILSSTATGTDWIDNTGGGTVTSVAAGDGMNFTTITNSGDVTMGTPSSITPSSTNSTTSTSHTHVLDITGVLFDGRVVTSDPTLTNNDYVVVLNNVAITEMYMPASSSNGQVFLIINRTINAVKFRNSTDSADVNYKATAGGDNTVAVAGHATIIQYISGTWYQINNF